MIPLPDAVDTDGDDVVWALQTASTLWKRGETTEAVGWVKRAAKSAGEAGDAQRAVTLGRAADELDAARPVAKERGSEPNMPVSAAAMLLLATTQTSAGISTHPFAAPPPNVVVLPSLPVGTPPARPPTRTEPLIAPDFERESLPPPSSESLEEINDLDLELAPASVAIPVPARAAAAPPPRKLTAPPGPPPTLASTGVARLPLDTAPMFEVVPPATGLAGAKDAALPPPRKASPDKATGESVPPPARGGLWSPPGADLAARAPSEVIIRDDGAMPVRGEPAIAIRAVGEAGQNALPAVAARPEQPSQAPRPRSVPPPRAPTDPRPEAPPAMVRPAPGPPPDPAGPQAPTGIQLPLPSPSPTSAPPAAISAPPAAISASPVPSPAPTKPGTQATPARPAEAQIAAAPGADRNAGSHADRIPLSELPLSFVPVPIPSIASGSLASRIPTIPPPSAGEEAVEVDVEVEAPTVARKRRLPRALSGLQLLDPWADTDHVVTSAPELTSLLDAERDSNLPPERAVPDALRQSSPPDTEPLSDDEIIAGDESAAASAIEGPRRAPSEHASSAGPTQRAATVPGAAPAITTPAPDAPAPVVDVAPSRVTPPEPVASRRTHPPPTVAGEGPASGAPPGSGAPTSGALVTLTGEEPFGVATLDSVAAFADLPRDVRRKLAAEARVLTLAVGEEAGDFALAYVHRGCLNVTAIVHDTPVTAIDRGAVLRSRASIEPCPQVRLVATVAGSVVAVWGDAAFSDAFQACTWVEDDLRLAATRPLALVGATTGPLSDRLDERHLKEVLASLELRLLGPHEVLVEQGDIVEGVALVGCGELERIGAGGVTETFRSGAVLLADEVLSAARAKGTVRAGAGGAAIFLLDRKKTQEIVMTYPPVLEIFAGM